MEQKIQEIETKFQVALETAEKLLREIGEMRSVNFSDIDPENKEQTEEAMKIAKDLDQRTSYLLRGLLIPYGGVLFL